MLISLSVSFSPPSSSCPFTRSFLPAGASPHVEREKGIACEQRPFPLRGREGCETAIALIIRPSYSPSNAKWQRLEVRMLSSLLACTKSEIYITVCLGPDNYKNAIIVGDIYLSTYSTCLTLCEKKIQSIHQGACLSTVPHSRGARDEEITQQMQRMHYKACTTNPDAV